MKPFVKIISFAFAVLLLAVFVPSNVASASPILPCPKGSDWVVVDVPGGFDYEYTAPNGYEVVSWCYRAGIVVGPIALDVPQKTVMISSTVVGESGRFELTSANFQIRPTCVPKKCSFLTKFFNLK